MIKLGMKHIRVLYQNEGSEWSNFSKLKNSIAQKWSELVNDAWALMFIESKLIQANWKAEVDKIVAEQKWELTAMQIQTIYTLYEFGEVGINMVWKDTVRGWKKFFALKKVLRKSTSEPHIMTFSNGAYTVTAISEYKSQIAAAPESINTWVVKWFVNLHKKWSPLWFPISTWENISVYCANRGWNTRIVGDNKEIATFLGTLYGEKKVKEEKSIDTLLQSLLPDIAKNDPRLAELLKKSDLERNPNGTINASRAIEMMKITNVNQVPWKFKDIADAMKKDAEELFKIVKEIAKSIPIKSLSELNIVWIEKWEVLKRPFNSFSENEIKKYTPIVQEHLKTIQDPDKKIETQKILTIFIALNKRFEKIRLAADAQLKAESSKKEIIKNPSTSAEQLWEKLDSKEEQNKAILAQEVAVSRTESNDQLDTLKIYGIDTLEKAQSKLQELEKKWELTKDEQILKSQLVWYIQAKIHEAQVLNTYGAHLTETDKQDIFTQTNRFISDNPTEQYNFQALEKITVLTDPEASIGARNLAKMEPGQSMSMDRFVEWDLRSPLSSAPEISNISVSMNRQGTYDIPTLWAVNLTKAQVQEYMTNVTLYADMWLSQLIPHLTMLTGELKKKWVNTAIDGSSNTMEQQQVLKTLYGQLFGKEVISSSLGEVERAYSSALGNPTSMKNAMQGVLKTYHLIWESGWSIAPDTLQKWIRQNKTENQKPTINLT